MKSNDGLADAARKHLTLLKRDHERQTFSDRYYVSLAYSYGLTAPEIAEESGLPLERVQQLLVGA